MNRLVGCVIVLAMALSAAPPAQALRVETIEAGGKLSDTESLRRQKRRLRDLESCWKNLNSALRSSAYHRASVAEKARILKQKLDQLALCQPRRRGLSRVIATSTDPEEMRFWFRLAGVDLEPVNRDSVQPSPDAEGSSRTEKAPSKSGSRKPDQNSSTPSDKDRSESTDPGEAERDTGKPEGKEGEPET